MLYLLNRFDKFYHELTQVCRVMFIEVHSLYCCEYEYRSVPVYNIAI